MKHLAAIALSALVTLTASAAVTQRWTVETSRVQPASFDAVRGESIALEATLQNYGNAVEIPTSAPVSIYWQTNGMASAWWTASASVVGSNVLAAVFTPEMDVGAKAYNCYIGSAGTSYRAAFQLRFREGPGAVPNELPLPAKTLDFAQVTVTNDPWTARIEALEEGSGGIDTNAVRDIVREEVPKDTVRTNSLGEIDGPISLAVNPDREANGYPITLKGCSTTPSESSIYVDTLGRLSIPYAHFRDGINIGNFTIDGSPSFTGNISFFGGVTFPSINGILLSPYYSLRDYLGENYERKGSSYPSADGEALERQVSAIGAHLNAEDAHFVSTNYDSVTRIPEAYVEIKMNGSWLTIWREMTRWNKWTGPDFDWSGWNGFGSWKATVEGELSHKAERNWGMYDSETGGLSPDGYTQISSSNILIAAGMAYQRTVTTDGAVWVLQCNTGTASIGGDTNGFFRIQDADGNTQFEIVKGDKREMGADATGIEVDNSTSPPTVTIPYSVESGEHPTIQVCTDLSTSDWRAEDDAACPATVSWSGSSGAWVSTVQRKTPGNQLFVRATYMAGGETYIRNVAPVGMDSIMLNGVRYYLGTATIDGHTVLTLSTTKPAN